MRPAIAICTPGAVANISPLLPSKMAGAATAWEWYHRCLSAVCEVQYYGLREWDAIHGYDAVFVHEGIEALTLDATVSVLAQLRRANRSVTWVEPHQRTTFGSPVFEDGFFDAVDRVAKFQLMEYGALVAGLRDPQSDLAPWALFGHSSVTDFYADAHLFGMASARHVIGQHLNGDLAPLYGSQIVPLPRLFTLPRPDSWYGANPSRQPHIVKETEVGLAAGEPSLGPVRGLVAGLLAQAGLGVKLFDSPVRAAATSEVFVGLGPVFRDGAAADVTRFETLSVLPEDPRYITWDDVFVGRETYLPLEGYGRLLREGGRLIDPAAARDTVERLAADLGDRDLREQILAGQRKAHAKLFDPRFVAGKLGIELPVAPSPAPVDPVTTVAPPAAPSPSVPVTVGTISSDQVSVVIQGALSGDDLTEQVIRSAREVLPGCEVVVSTWQGSRTLTEAVDVLVESEDPGAAWQVHEEWPSNTNRLLTSTKAGLAAATRPYTLKLRSDTPLIGTGFLEMFQAYPDRGEALRLLRDRIVVIDLYCWNPERRPFGLLSVADTVHFGWTEDVRAVWDRPLDDEPSNSIWFQSHSRPENDEAPWANFRYTPEQLMWLGFLRKHVAVPFDHYADVSPAAELIAAIAAANNLVIVEFARFGVALPKFAGREELEPGAVYTHAMWDELFERYAFNSPNEAVSAFAAALDPALAPDPDDDRAVELWRGHLNGLAEQAVEATVHPFARARSFVVLADAEELLGCDDLLEAYADGMRGCETATLAIDASRMSEEKAAELIMELARRCGLLEREDLDLIALVGSQSPAWRRRIIRAAGAVYGRGPHGPGPLPAFTPETITQARELAGGATVGSAEPVLA